MYSYTIALNNYVYHIYHEKRFSSVEFAKMYNEIAEYSRELTELDDIIQRFCRDYGFIEVENPVTLELARAGIPHFANMYSIDINKINEKDNYIDVYVDRKSDED